MSTTPYLEHLEEYFKGFREGKKPYYSLLGKSHSPAEGYMPSFELKGAVHIALLSGKPLLLSGEPGTGKTALAYWLEKELETELFRYNIKTTTTNKDLFYQYDALGHFRAAQHNKQSEGDIDIEDFIHYNALGNAILYARKEKEEEGKKKRPIVLLDEIDKAPRDLPNDILFEIEEMKFEVPEIRTMYSASQDYRPIVIMTSNSEKDFPDAFLRRCVYFHIDFPDKDQLANIFQAKLESLKEQEIAAKEASQHVWGLRDKDPFKKPSTEEALQWAAHLLKEDFPLKSVNKPDKLSVEEQETLNASYSYLAKTKKDLKDFRGGQ